MKTISSLSMLLLLLLTATSHGQYLFSASANGGSAFLASRMEGHSFVANPAFLGRSAPQNHYFLQTEANTGETPYRSPFDSDFPDVEIWIPVTARLNIGIRKIYGFPDPWFSYLRSSFDNQNNVPIPSRLQNLVEFRYEQGWSYGVGFSCKKDLSLGLSLRHATYRGTSLGDEYLTFDLGSLYQVTPDVHFALVLRDFFPWRIDSSARHYVNWYYPDPAPPSEIYYWDINQWRDVRLKPEPYAELGVSYTFRNTIELLADYSSRNEYAWGVRVRFSKEFSAFGGHANRYDHLLKVEPMATGSIGGQIKIRFVTFSGSFVWDQKHYYTGEEKNQYGQWSSSQVINKAGLFSLGFTF